MTEISRSPHLTEDDLVLHHYGEPSAPGAAAHLEGCEACRRALTQLRHVLAAVEGAPVPDPGPFYETRAWHRLQPRLAPARPATRSWGRLHPGRLAMAASLVVLLAASFMAGLWRGRVDGDGSIPAEVRQRVLQLAVADHLDRSQLLLTELVNEGDGETAGPAAAPDPAATSARLRQAESLIAAGRIYRQTASSLGDPGLAAVLDDLERVLLEVAHAVDPSVAESLERLRQYVRSSGILTKIRMMGRQIRGAPAQVPGKAPGRAGQRT